MANDFKRGIRVYLETSDYGKGIDAMVAATKKYEAELADLTEESNKMTAEGKNSGKAWDDLNKKITAHEKQLTKSKTAEADYRAKLQQTEKVLNNLSGVSYDELIEVQKRLQKETRKTDRDLDAHKIKLAQLDRVNREVSNAQAEMNTHIGQSGSFMSRTANGFNKYFAVFTAALATITGLTMGLKKFMDMRMELEDSKANLKSITGLGDEDANWLVKYAKDLSTSTTEAGVRITASSKEIVDGFTKIGSKRPELLKNKEAMAAVTKEALTLAATGMPVETAFEVATAAMNQFNLNAKDSGRIINTIAAGSLEGSAEADSLAGSLKNVGTVAADSNMTLEQTVAALEVLASKQLVGEEAGTKLRGALLKMKDAGVGYTSGLFNMRDAIVEINTKMAEKSTAAERDALLQKVFGAENVTAGTILLKNVEAYDKLTIAVTGTNVAYNQAKINTETVSAKLKQSQNRISELGMELVKGLNPAMLSASNITGNILKLIIKMPAFLKENAWQLGSLAVVWGIYTVAVNASTIAQKLSVFWTDKVVVSFNKMGAAMKANPWVYIATGAILAIGWLNNYLNKQEEVNAEQKKFNDLAEKSKELFGETRSLEDRAKAMKSLSKTQLESLQSDLEAQISAMGKFDADVKTRAEKALSEDAELIKLKKAHAAAKTEIERQATLTPIKWREEALLQQLADEYLKNKQSLRALEKYLSDVKILIKKQPKDNDTITTPDKDAYEKALKEKEDAYKASQLELMELRRKGELTEEIYNKIALQTQLAFLEEKKKLQEKFKKSTIDTEIEISTQSSKIQKDIDDAILKVTKDTLDAGNAAIESGFQTKQSMLQDALNMHSEFNGKTIISEREYTSEMKRLIVEQITARVALAEASLQSLKVANFSDGKVKATTIAQAEADLLKLKGELTKAQGDVAKDTAKTVEKDTLTIAERMEGVFGKSFSNIGNLFTNFTKSLDSLKKGDLKSWSDWGNAIGGVVEGALSVATQINDEYFAGKAASLEADKQRELTNAGDNAEEREKINQKYAQKELDLKKKQSSADTVLKVAQAVAAGGLAIVQAFAQLGPIGGAIAAVLVGGITTLQVASILKQNAAIQNTTLDSSSSSSSSSSSAPTSTGARVVTQAADGRWDVIGADDGRVYRNVPYRGVARTGLVTSPTLMGESGTELVVDNPTLQNIYMNAPWIIDIIKNNRVPQRASGNYSSIDAGTAGNSSPAGGYGTSDKVIEANIAVMSKLITLIQYLIDNGIDAHVLLNELEKQQALLAKSKSKGSLT